MGCFETQIITSHKFVIDHCKLSVKYDANKVNEKTIRELSKACFELYKHRLERHSDEIIKIGEREYDIINEKLISLILPFDPLNFSFSITDDPSLHFFVKFSKDISLFIETYLDIEDGNDTYVEILKSNRKLRSVNCMFDDAASLIENCLYSEYPDKRPVYELDTETLTQCKNFQKDLFQMSIRSGL